MPSTAARSAAVAALALAATAVVVPPAHAADGDDYRVTLTSSTATTDYKNRTVDLTGTLTRTDGTPVADAPVQLEESVLLDTWNPWGDPTDFHMAFADTTVKVKPVTSSIAYQVNKTTVREGDTLVVRGRVTWPAGHGPIAGTRVFLRTYFESAYNAQTTTDARGNFTVRAKIRDYDNEFVVFSAPKDYYIAGASKDLPVKNVTP